jgi:hypothetical protein
MQIKKVSKKKILFVDIDEEIPQIFERVKMVPYAEVYLVVPTRAVILQSVVNLKILKSKLEDIEKTLFLVTNDASGMKLAMQAEIKVFDTMAARQEDAPERSAEDFGTELLKPVSASSNDVSDGLPSRLPKKKSSIFEVVSQVRSREKPGFSLREWWKRMRPSADSIDTQASLEFFRAHRKTLSTLVLGSLATFLIVAYLVLPGATIVIEPSSDVITRGTNITLEKNPNGPRSLKSYPLSTSIDLTLQHSATGFKDEGTPAAGEIIVFNKQGAEQVLIASTRFQSSEGIVFRISEDVTVPAGSEVSPGQIKVHVVADSVDAGGSPVGARGNLDPTHFILPGLKEDKQSLVYGESLEPMSGGTSNGEAFVEEDDLEAARSELEEKLKDAALDALRQKAAEQSSAGPVTLRLLEDSDAIKYGTAVIELPLSLVGQSMEQFEVKGSLNISGVAYDSSALDEILRQEVILAETPGKQVIKINEDSASITLLEADLDRSYYKFTAEMQGIEEFEIDPDLEGGLELSERIKEHVAGRSVEEALTYIQNLPEVNRVEIHMWPRWAPKIPSLPENIRVKSSSQGRAVTLD